MSADTARTDPLVAALEWVAYNFGLEYRGIAWDNFAAQLRDRLAALPSAPDQRLREALRVALDRLADYVIATENSDDAINTNEDREFIREARAALSEATTSPEATLDVRRVKQAITNVAVRHRVVKDPLPPQSLLSIYGYSAAPADMDAEIAAEYARLRGPA